MKKIKVFYGSNREYEKIVPSEYRNLSDIVMQLDAKGHRHELWIKGISKLEEQQAQDTLIKVSNFVIFADEYGSVNEHVLINFSGFLGRLDVSNMYIQNPPIHLLEQIKRIYGKHGIIFESCQEYQIVTENHIRAINDKFENKIIGQNIVKQQILKAIYPIMNNVQSKPVVMMFYGESGLGKTETAQFLTKIIGGKLLRKQFSMYQNSEFANYLFGGKYNEKSFAKDLVSRDANLILLDEFDKANVLFRSAFYQLFDEGIFEDNNYRVDVKHAIIICTSNYHSKEEIKEKLGLPMYNRFDAVIGFEELSNEAKMKIAAKEMEELGAKEVLGEDQCDRVMSVICSMKNVREIRRIIKDSISLCKIRQICSGNKEEL